MSAAARRELLARLLRLNHERHAAEVAAGLHEKGKSKKSKGGKAKIRHAEDDIIDLDAGDQLDLLPDNPPTQKRLM